MGSWHTFLAFPSLCSRWLCWRWCRVHFRITAQLRGLWQSSSVNKENYESFEILTEEWLVRKRILSCKSVKPNQSRTKAAAVVDVLALVCEYSCAFVNVLVCIGFCVGVRSDICLQVCTAQIAETKAFHNDTLYVTHPTVNSASIQQHVFGSSRRHLFFFFFFPDRSRLAVINTKLEALSKYCCHILLWSFYRISLSRLARTTRNVAMFFFFFSLSSSTSQIQPKPRSQLLVVDQERCRLSMPSCCVWAQKVPQQLSMRRHYSAPLLTFQSLLSLMYLQRLFLNNKQFLYENFEAALFTVWKLYCLCLRRTFKSHFLNHSY